MRIKQICVVMLVLFASIGIEMRSVRAQVTPQPPKPSAAIPLEMIGDPGGGAPMPSATFAALFWEHPVVSPRSIRRNRGQTLRGSGINAGLSQLRNPFDGGQGQQPIHSHSGPRQFGVKGLPVTASPELLRYGRQGDGGPASQPLRWWGRSVQEGTLRLCQPSVQHRARYGRGAGRCVESGYHARCDDSRYDARPGRHPPRAPGTTPPAGGGRPELERSARMRSGQPRRPRVRATAVPSRRPPLRLP